MAASTSLALRIDPPLNVAPGVADAVRDVWGKLSVEQQEAFIPLITPTLSDGLFCANPRFGKSVCISGSAGTGKSFFIHTVRRVLATLYPNMVVTGMTGMAAWNLCSGDFEARTLHSIVPLGRSFDDAMRALNFDGGVRRLYLRTIDVLVVDEVSMMSLTDFMLLNDIMQAVRQNNRLPFGGVVLVFVGDMKQLPPVPNKKDVGTDSKTFFFLAHDLFRLTFGDRVFEFTENKRQEQRKWAETLERVGSGTPDEADISLLRARKTGPYPDDAIRIYCTNEAVDNYNSAQMRRLDAPSFQVMPETGFNVCKEGERNLIYAHDRLETAIRDMCAEYQLPSALELKPGSHVVLTANEDVGRGLVNGATFVVVRYVPRLPDAGPNSSDGILVAPMARHGEERRPNFVLHRKRWSKWVEKSGEAWVEAYPLRLCWATTVHRTQGLTFPKGKQGVVCIEKAFEAGQAYVALSRFSCLEDIFLISFQPHCLKVSQRLAEWREIVALAKKSRAAKTIRADMIALASRRKAIESARKVAEEEEALQREMQACEELVNLGCFDSDSETESESTPSRVSRPNPPTPPSPKSSTRSASNSPPIVRPIPCRPSGFSLEEEEDIKDALDLFAMGALSGSIASTCPTQPQQQQEGVECMDEEEEEGDGTRSVSPTADADYPPMKRFDGSLTPTDMFAD